MAACCINTRHVLVMVSVDSSSLQADSQHKSFGLVWWSAVTWRRSTFIKWAGEFSHWLCQDDSTINIGICIMMMMMIIIIIVNVVCAVRHVIISSPWTLILLYTLLRIPAENIAVTSIDLTAGCRAKTLFYRCRQQNADTNDSCHMPKTWVH